MFELPWPPSVNRYWRNVRGRVLISKEGRQYKRAIKMLTLTGKMPRLGQQRISMRIDAFPPDRRRRDLDNTLKVVADSLQDAGLFDDDSQIDEIHIKRGHIVKGGALLVELKAIA